MIRSRFAVLALLLAALPLSAQQEPAKPIRLVVALTVDQLRADYLDRFRGEFTGGVGRLLREGVFYPNGEQDHAITQTAPGHSTTMSGRTPASTGILSNDLGVPDPATRLIGSTGAGASPWRFRGTTLADWLKARDSATRVLSVSRKDRGAILPVGRQVAPIFWYSQGKFTTSRYYADTLPTWLQEWNARDPIKALAGTEWRLGRDASSYAEVDDRPFESGGNDRTFPHRLPDDWTMASGQIEHFSVMDSLTFDVALSGIRAMRIGQRDGTDFFALSLSALDNIGHRWGPGSREVHDHMLNLDRWLGAFLDSLGRTVPLDQVVISLTADHGVTEFPEAGQGGRASITAVANDLNRWALSRWGIKLGAASHSGLLVANLSALRARGVNIDSLARAVATRVRTLPGVRGAHTPASLAAAPRTDAEANRWRRQYLGGMEWLVAVSVQPDWVWGSSKVETGHGSTNMADFRVPILFRVPGVAPARIEQRARTIDIAPTLAAVLRVRPTEAVDGVALTPVLPRRASR
jgi:arylsulfatase A-like enzyme